MSAEKNYHEQRATELGLPPGTGKRYNYNDLLNFYDRHDNPVKQALWLVRGFMAAGFQFTIRRHQGNDVVINATVDTIKSVPSRGQLIILTQETLQYPPSTILVGRREDERVLLAISETTSPLHTSQIIIAKHSSEEAVAAAALGKPEPIFNLEELMTPPSKRIQERKSA